MQSLQPERRFHNLLAFSRMKACLLLSEMMQPARFVTHRVY